MQPAAQQESIGAGLDRRPQPDPDVTTPASLLRRLAAASISLAILAPAALSQDTIGDGFAATASQPTPVAFASYATLSGGERVVFDGLSIDLYDAGGTFLQNLAVLPAFVFNSFVEVDPGETFAVIGESSNGDVFKIALDGSGLTPLTTLEFNYDAAFEDANHVIVSASLCSLTNPFGCGNDLARVNTDTGATTIIASVPGPSGPVAFDENGDLFYGLVDITVPSNSQLIVWEASELSGSPLLDEGDADVFHGGLESATSLAIDPVFGNVLLVESVFGGTSRILEFDAATGALADVVVESPSYLTNVELLRGDSAGHFHAYQPADGVFMHYNNGDIVTVRPQQPTATHTQLGSVATFSIQGAKPNSAMLLVFGAQQLVNPDYYSYQLQFDFLFHCAVPIQNLRRTPLLIPTDANGDGTFQYFDPGHLAGNWAFQAIITDESGQFIGGSQYALN